MTAIGETIPHMSGVSSELSPQSSSPSQTQKWSLQRELLHRNSSALQILPPSVLRKRRLKISSAIEKVSASSICSIIFYFIPSHFFSASYQKQVTYKCFSLTSLFLIIQIKTSSYYYKHITFLREPQEIKKNIL